jgi:ATP-binding cassette subfamily B protein RaxB
MSPDTDSTVERVGLFQGVLRAAGHDISVWALVEGCAGDLSLRGFARCAREQGLEARLTLIAPGDVAYVRTGALIEFGDKRIARVAAHTPRVTEIVEPDGKRGAIARNDEAQPIFALEVNPPTKSLKLLGRLMDRLRSEPKVRGAITFAASLGVVAAALGLAGPLLSRYAFGFAIPNQASSQLALIAFGCIVVGLQVLYVTALRRAALLYISMKFSESASTDLVAHMLRLPLATLLRMDVGEIRQAVASASTAAEALVLTLLPQVVDAALGCSFLVLIFALDPLSGLVTLGVGAFILLLGYVSGHRRLAMRRAVLERRRAQLQVLYESFAGVETVKSENVEGRMLGKWLDRLVAEEQEALSLRLETSRVNAVLDAVERFAFCAVLVLTGKRCLDGAATVADLVAVVQASAGFMVAVLKLGRLPGAFADFRGDVERVDAVLAQTTERDDGPRRPPDAGAPALVLRDVWFRYEDDTPWVLMGLHLHVRQGERLVLAWPSGAGKSTLLRILAGMVPPTRGDALIYGTDASRARRMVTYIPQQATLFQASVLENLRLLSDNAHHERIFAAADATGLSEIVSSWAMGMETMISGGVANVSSGQRQLILLTAAVASESPIVLLDEALAHMDLDMRSRLGATDLFHNRTVISVVHDASTAESSRARVMSMAAMQQPVGLLRE